jgi:hypothetical protein
LLRGLAADSKRYLDARAAETLNSLAARAFVGVLEGDDHAFGACGEEEIGAGGTALALVGAGFERRVDRCGSSVT